MESVCPSCRAPLPRPTDPIGRDSSASCPSCGKVILLATSGEFASDQKTTMARLDRSSDVPEMDEPTRVHPGSVDASAALESVGRYQLLRPLGRGGFGVVYLARDEVLGREVAVKLPRRDQFASDSRFAQFVREARMAARLRHPAIVTVHDIGQTDDGAYYIVLEFLPGGTLRELLERRRLPVVDAVQLFVQVADAVAYANEQGLIHRDLKPSNILLDGTGRPFVSDFGLAFFSSAPQLPLVSVVGTPSYMAPEQVRGETHRLDRRTDIWGLGVILYLMLTGRLPFSGAEKERFAAIQVDEPPLPRDQNPSVPRELERICLKCLSKRMTDRYDTAAALAAELRDWLRQHEQSASWDLGESVTLPLSAADSRQPRSENHMRSTQRELQVIPKGLRFFTEQDAHFFLELLPGPRDRDGLPESIRFWKQALESREPGACFTVGLLFGPSGCGKTSFLKAGLAPRLAPHVIPIYFAATSDDSETRLLAQLRRRFPALPASGSLTEILALLRDHDFVPPDQKLVLILDQFEQWLYHGRRDVSGDLSRAMRQCDGVRVQCLLSVRDDFGMAVTRFMSELEVPLVQGHNFSTVDRFDLRHARKVLAAFGRAFGQLPPNASPSAAQDRFLDQAIRELAEEDRVIPVRLALFAEMIKSSPWTPETLRRLGGAEGVGVAFLEETFSPRGGNPIYQRHAEAARQALRIFLPEHGGNIRGGRVSRERLIAVVAYENRPDDFQTLLRVLAHELRLITTADPENEAIARSATADDESSQSESRSAAADSFQLTHDYLVPAIRTWLTRRQRATRRGRAELCLAERAAQWQSHPEPRFLPTFLEWTGIELQTRPRDWTAAQRLMLRAASRYYGARLLAIAAATLLLVAGIVHYERRGRELTNRAIASRIMRSLQTAETAEVPRIVDELTPHRPEVNGALQATATNSFAPFRHQLHATLALLPAVLPGRSPTNSLSTATLTQRLLTLAPEANPAQLAMIAESFRQELGALGPDFSAACWRAVLNDEEFPRRRLQYAALLATVNSTDNRWDKAATAIVRQMSLENPVHLPQWTAALSPVADRLTPAAREIFMDKSAPTNQRALAAQILATYLQGNVEALVALVRIAEPEQFTLLMEPLRSQPRAADLLQAALDEKAQTKWPIQSLQTDWKDIDATLRATFETAHGFCHSSFAYCQSLPLAEFSAVAAALRPAGYRPSLFRPYRTPNGTLVAAIWERDGRDWQVAHGRTAAELRQDDQRFREMGYLPVDVAEETDGESPGELRFAGLWVQKPPQVTDAKLYVYIPESDHQDYWGPLNEQRYVPRTNVLSRPASDQPHYTSVRWRMTGIAEYMDTWDATSDDLTTRDAIQWPLADVRVGNAPSQGSAKFSAVWWDGGGRESKSLANVPFDAHTTTCRDLVDQGWRPAALSAAWASADGKVAAASVWQRPSPSHQDLDEHARQQANVAAALLALGSARPESMDPNTTGLVVTRRDAAEKVWPLLCTNQQPRTRAWLIENLTPLLLDPTSILLGRLSQENDPTARAGILLALVPSAERGLLAPAQKELGTQLASSYRDTANATERSAVYALLHALGAADQLISQPEPRREPSPDRNWFTTATGNTMVTIRGPRELAVGAGGDDPEHEPYFETRHRVVIPRSFAISATEVTAAEYMQYKPDYSYAREYCNRSDCPAMQVNILDAMRYCRWLSEREGVPETQQCYPPIDQITENMHPLTQDWLTHTGYRLPTEAEWECACRAETDTPRPFGNADALLGRYAWTANNSLYRSAPVASRLPNAWGLFDMLGNVGELTMSTFRPYPKPATVAVPDEGYSTAPPEPVWRGGAFLYQPADARSSHRSRFTKRDGKEVSVGFRIARTIN